MRPVAVALVLVVAGCGAKTGLDLNPGCETEADCPDENYCGPVPLCAYHACTTGAPRSCDDGVACTTDGCSSEARACTHVPRDRDGDGHGDHLCGGDDCDDSDPTVHPGARELCTNGRDDDCDGHFDCSDPDCASDPACRGCMPEVCTGGRDEDCDSLIDCADMDCFGDPACCTPTETRCSDLRDDDCDGLVDCADPDCAGTPACCVPTPEVCDGMDQDCDGVPDDGVRCYYIDGVRVDAITTPVCGSDWYSYGSPSSASANPVPDVRVSGAVVVAVQEGPASCGGATLAVIADMVDDGSGGMLVGQFVLTPPPAGGGVLVSDDPTECHAGSGGTVTCNWTWQPCCTDGVLLGTFTTDFCADVQLTVPVGVDRVLVRDGPTRTTAHGFGAMRVCGLTTPAVP